MARIVIHSDTRTLAIPVIIDEDEGAYGDCPSCGERITDRGHFEDTLEAIQIHVDRETCS